jgi:CelD/BcsL family acetyltransferase involved in cellulose biosynthesis
MRIASNTRKARAECVATMRVTTVRPGDLGPDEAETWATFQRSSPLMLSPYLSLTFAQIVGSARPNARIAVVEDAGQIVAFLAYEPTSMKLAEPIGYPMNDLQGIISADTEIDARSIIRKAGLRGWRFYYTPAQHRPLIPHHYSDTTVQCALIDLSEGYQSWISGHSKSGTKRVAEKRRSLQRHVGPVSLLWNSSRPEHLGQLLEWKTGKHSWMRRMFADDPSAIRIVEDMAAASSPDCSGVVSVLRAGDHTVAVHLGLQGPRGLSSWFPSYDSELSRFSPGLMMWYPIAEEAANRGVMLIDFGYGQHDYKFRLANGSYPVAGGAVWASQIEEVARGAYRRALGIVRQGSNMGAHDGDTQSDRLQRPVVSSH